MEAGYSARVEKVLQEIRSILKAEGGDIELVQISEDGVVQIRFIGICGTCGGSLDTLRRGAERMLKEQVPEVKQVLAV